MRCDVEADRLAALMVLDRNLEPVPEPFRMQPEVELVINFDEYLKFIESLSSNCQLLYFTADALHKAINTRNDQSLLRAFYVDMALAVSKELFFAEYTGKGSTVIRHEFYYCQEVRHPRASPETEGLLRQVLTDRGFGLPPVISMRNRRHWLYACDLLQSASETPVRWVKKL